MSAARLERDVAAVHDLLNRVTPLNYASSLAAHTDGVLPDSIAAIALDTNALKQIRRDAVLATAVSAYASDSGIPLIIPAQAIQEFWNNHRVFLKGSEVLEREIQSLGSTLRRISSSAMGDSLRARMTEVQEALSAFEADASEARDPNLFAKSAAVLRELESVAMIPAVPRARFADVGQIRFASKVPPGFEDHDKFPRHLGDFFVWAELLLGLRQLRSSGQLHREGRVLLFTEDSKDDWQTNGRPHPILLAEMHTLTGLVLEIQSPSNLPDLS